MKVFSIFKNNKLFVLLSSLLIAMMCMAMFTQASSNLDIMFDYDFSLNTFRGVTLGIICLAVISVFYFKPKKCQNNIRSSLLYFTILVTVSIFLNSDDFANGSFSALRYSILHILLFLCYYKFAYNIEDKCFYLLLIIILIAFSITYYQIHEIVFLQLSTSSIWVSAYVVILLPLVLLIPNKVLRTICIAIIIVVVLTNTKRTALIATFLALFLYYIINTNVKNRSLLNTIIVFAFLFIVANFVFDYFDTISDNALSGRFKDMDQSDGVEGRIDIYKKIISLIGDFDFVALLVGKGYDSVAKYIDYSAHNDILEVLFDYGILGLVLYLRLHYSIIKQTVRLWNNKSPYTASLASSYVIFLIFTLFSHVIIYMTFSLFAIGWGYIIGKEEIRLQCNRFNNTK